MVYAWNDFFGPLLYLKSRENWTLVLGLSWITDIGVVDYNLQMAGGVLASVPVVIVFLLSQRSFVEGVTLTGLKG